MNKEEADLIIAEQNKSKEEILKAVAKVKSDYHELCKLKDMRIAELEKENAELKARVEKQNADILFLKHLTEELEKEKTELKDALKGKRCNCMTYFNFKDLENNLTKAKELLKEFIFLLHNPRTALDTKTVMDEAEQFISELEK